MNNAAFCCTEFVNRFQQAMDQECQVPADDSILVAVSGGADSVALLHLLVQQGYSCLAAHCNFSLRGEESNGDEAFVRDFCRSLKVPCRFIRFDTRAFADQNKMSIEMAARQLRYDWFSELLVSESLDWIATGHHGNDAIETFFLNLTRGTGIKGLTGIAWQRDRLIRPLLFARSEEIVAYCSLFNLEFRTDSTNRDTTILRNKIRHQLVPLLTGINPAFFDTMQRNMGLLHEAGEVFEEAVAQFVSQYVVVENGSVIIPVSKIHEHPQRRSFLFAILRSYGFNSAVVDEVVKGLTGIAGRQYFSDTHRLVRDRYNLLVVEREELADEVYYIEADDWLVNKPLGLKLKVFKKEEAFRFSTNPKVAHFDADQIDFPLTIRRWRQGDQFQPLGMEQFQKLSDFFINQKLSILDKEQTWLLLSNDDIIWIIGRRMDNRYKITGRTRNILEIEITGQVD